MLIYRDRLKDVQLLLSNCQAGPDITVKQEQEESSHNHVQTFIYLSVHVPSDIHLPAYDHKKYIAPQPGCLQSVEEVGSLSSLVFWWPLFIN